MSKMMNNIVHMAQILSRVILFDECVDVVKGSREQFAPPCMVYINHVVYHPSCVPMYFQRAENIVKY